MDFKKPKDCLCLLLQNYEDSDKNRGATCCLNKHIMVTFDVRERYYNDRT